MSDRTKTPLWKTTIVIWSDFDPSEMELDDLARDATSGESICTKQEVAMVEEPDQDPDWEENEFFDADNDHEGE